MIGADVLLKSLENNGVEQIFAYPGGTVLPIYDRMQDFPSIRRILVRHEQGAAFAAQGYSRATQKVGVCLATSGPGATNLVTGIADAMMDSVPMIALTGNVFAHLIGSDAFQEIDIVGVCEPIVKHSYFAESANDIPRIVAEAFHLAASGRPGPVLIDIPKSVQIEKVNEDIIDKCTKNHCFGFDLPGYFPEPETNLMDMEKVVGFIEKSQRPVVIFGHGVVLGNAEASLAEFLNASQIPCTWTLHGIGAFDPNHSFSLGMLGMHGTASANFAVHNADLIIGLGIRFDDRITGIPDVFAKDKKIIHFDIDPAEFNKNIVADAKIVGNLSKTLPAVNRKVKPAQSKLWQDLLEEKKKKWPLDMPKPGHLTEIAVINEIFAHINNDSVVTVDVGQNEMWTAQRFPGKKSRKFLASGGLGTMGFSLPTAMGAAFSGHETWAIVGDGGFQMNMQELGTIAQDNIPVKICILNNGFLGMVRQWQELFYERNYEGTPLLNPDFVMIGQAYGIPSFRAQTLEEAQETIKKMKAVDGPVLCEFYVEREENVFPMVPAGESLGNTLLNANDRIDTL